MCLAQTPEMFGYDADGNLTNDGKWSYTWDAENRLAGIQSASAIPAAAKRQLAYAYDNQGRRIYAKIMEWNTNTASYQLVTEERYWYDGWNMIGRADLATALVQTFVWGLDLSGSLQEAGGVGGLLMLDDSQGASYFYDYDGNGNVLGLVNAHDGTTAAQYDYGPFGELLRANGKMARANPMRFSTKFCDDETGFLYYGHRYYNASTGSWPNRDPFEEAGGKNLYGFVRNDAVNEIDLFGLLIKCKCPEAYFDANGLKGKYEKGADDTYSAKSGESFSGNGPGEIVWNMLQTSRSFTAQDMIVDNLKKHITARQNVVATIGKVGWNFGTDLKKKFNRNYWDSMMTVKSGVTSSDAINDLFSSDASQYQTGCNNTSMLILLKGILDTIGASQFNASVPVTGGSISGAALMAKLLRVDNVTPGGTSPTLGDWVPGDRGYIQGGNQGANRLAAGEWIIYEGGGQFWGFDSPPHQTDLPGMMEAVRQFSGGASETGQRWYPGVGLQK